MTLVEHPTLGRLLLREIVDSDVAYCARSWLATHRDSVDGRILPDRQYHALHGPMVRDMLADPTLVRTVVSLESDPGFICAFGVAEVPGDGPAVLHYLHVRGPFRGQGLATLLAAALGVRPGETFVLTHDTRDARRLPSRWRVAVRPDLLERR